MNRTSLTTAAAIIALVAACAQPEANQEASYNAEQDDAYASQAGTEAAPAEDAYGEEAYGEDSYETQTAQAPEADELPDAYADDTLSDDIIADELATQELEEGLDGATYGPAEPMPVALAEDEALSQSRDEFAMADTNGDGALTREEFLATMAPAATDYGTPIGEGDVSYGDEIEDGQMADAGEVATLDADTSRYLSDKFRQIAGPDEEVTVEELENARAADFANADVNGDQVLEGEEVETFAALKTGRSPY